jgi:putative endonuclease
MAKLYHVYILASRSRVLYTEMTNNLIRRVCEHREGKVPGFTWHYRIHRLVYCEPFSDVRAAIVREKQIKAWTRRAALIEKRNPVWKDLSTEWFAAFTRKANPSLRSE